MERRTESSMTTTQEERQAVAAIQAAAQALMRAVELAKRAGYGSQIVGSLGDAQRDLRYALDTAAGRN
jgi:hypothetical protein